jgi:hypothetical protein
MVSWSLQVFLDIGHNKDTCMSKPHERTNHTSFEGGVLVEVPTIKHILTYGLPKGTDVDEISILCDYLDYENDYELTSKVEAMLPFEEFDHSSHYERFAHLGSEGKPFFIEIIESKTRNRVVTVWARVEPVLSFKGKYYKLQETFYDIKEENL